MENLTDNKLEMTHSRLKGSIPLDSGLALTIGKGRNAEQIL